MKFVNFFCLKLVVCLINEDKDWVLNIVRDVVKYFIMDGLEDDFFYNKSVIDCYMFGGNFMDNCGVGLM